MKHILLLLEIFIFAALVSSGCSSAKKMMVPQKVEHNSKQKAHDYFLKGLFLQQEEDYNEALIQYYQALLHDSTSNTIYNSIAENHMKLGHFDTALYYAKKSAEIEKDDSETLKLLAECYINLHEDQKAIDVLKKQLKIDPYNQEARNYILYLYQKNGDDISKAEQYEEMINLYGNDPVMLETMAKIYLKHDDFERALHFYNEALKVDSTNIHLLLLMGIICEQHSKNDKAIGYYQKILELDNENEDAIEHTAMLYRRKQNWQEIIDIYQPMFKGDPDNLNTRVAMAEAYYYLKELDNAQKMLKPALKKSNAPWGVYDLMGRIELENKNYEQALNYFNTIIEMDSTNRFGWLFLGFTYSDMGDIPKAETVYEKAVKILPDDASMWSYYGLTLYSQKKYRAAIEPLKKALAIEPLSMNVLTTLPIIYENLEMYAESDSLYEVAIKLFPDNYLLLNNYGYSLSERGIRMDEALAMSQKAVKGQPDNAAFLDTMGWIYFKLGKYDEAKKYIEKSIELEMISPVVLEHLGDVYLKLNDTEKALNYWIDSLNINPENRSLIEKVEKYK